MNILIAGGYGYLGAQLASRLANLGHDIYLGTRNTISPPAWLPQAKVTKLEWSQESALIRASKNMDVVIQAAGIGAQDSAKDPVEALNFNGVCTARLLNACIISEVKKFIYISTAHVYANNLHGYISENTPPYNLHPYATSHLAGEYVVLNAAQNEEIDGVVLRLANVYGVPIDKNINCWKLLINDLCRQAVTEKRLLLRSNGLQQRDYISMNKACEVIAEIVINSANSMRSGIFNVGSGESFTAIGMAELIRENCKEVLNFEPAIERVHYELEDKNPRLEYSIKKLEEGGISTKDFQRTREIHNLLKFCRSTFI